jgi:hypothetical protein
LDRAGRRQILRIFDQPRTPFDQLPSRRLVERLLDGAQGNS